MKKLIIVVHEDSEILQFLRQTSMYYTKLDDNTFMYLGTLSPWDKAAGLIATFHPFEFNFYQTSSEYRLSIWPK